MYKIQRHTQFNDSMIAQIVEVWQSSVRASHHFLSEQAILDLIPQVKEGVRAVKVFLTAQNKEGHIVAFAGVDDGKIEMLFVDADLFGQGIGAQLLMTCIDDYQAHLVDVNEQNPQALGFYEHFGFQIIGRSMTDEAGNPYPILHLCLRD